MAGRLNCRAVFQEPGQGVEGGRGRVGGLRQVAGVTGQGGAVAAQPLAAEGGQVFEADGSVRDVPDEVPAVFDDYFAPAAVLACTVKVAG